MTFEQELMRTRSALFLDGWLRFNEETWGYKAERVMYALPGKDRPALEAVLYLDRRGHVRMPPCNAYLPLQFFPTPTEKNCQLYTQWMSVAKLLAEDIDKRGISSSIAFPPGFVDARAFQWLGYEVTFHYTFVTKLPLNEMHMDKRVMGHIEKAKKLGYYVERTNNCEEILFCLEKTSQFQKFDNICSQSVFKKLENSLHNEYLFAHVSYDQNDMPCSAQIKLMMPNGICIGWQAGTDRQHIKNGVNQLLYYSAIDDLIRSGGKYFDNCGANIESVASAKAAWGFELVPYMCISDHSLRGKAKNLIGRIHGARKTWHYMKRMLKR